MHVATRLFRQFIRSFLALMTAVRWVILLPSRSALSLKQFSTNQHVHRYHKYVNYSLYVRFLLIGRPGMPPYRSIINNWLTFFFAPNIEAIWIKSQLLPNKLLTLRKIKILIKSFGIQISRIKFNLFTATLLSNCADHTTTWSHKIYYTRFEMRGNTFYMTEESAALSKLHATALL